MSDRCSDLRTTIEVGVIVVFALTVGVLIVLGLRDAIAWLLA